MPVARSPSSTGTNLSDHSTITWSSWLKPESNALELFREEDADDVDNVVMDEDEDDDDDDDPEAVASFRFC